MRLHAVWVWLVVCEAFGVVRNEGVTSEFTAGGPVFHVIGREREWSLHFTSKLAWLRRDGWGEAWRESVGALVRVAREGTKEILESVKGGVEHSFLIPSSPAGGLPYSILLDVAYPAGLVLVSSPNELVLVEESTGAAVFRYANLVVTDANDRVLLSTMEVSGARINLTVLEDGSFPVIVDPLSSSPSWFRTGKDPPAGYEGDGTWAETFGFSLAVCDLNNDGNLDWVIGAPSSDYSVVGLNNRMGRIYVHIGNSSGLPTTVQEITPPQLKAEQWFGSAIACGRHTTDAYDDLVVGAFRWSDPSTWPNPTEGPGWGWRHVRGRVYLFKITEYHTGTSEDPISWTKQQWFTPDDSLFNFAGTSLAMFKNPSDPNYPTYSTLFVGAPYKYASRAYGEFHYLFSDSRSDNALFTSLDGRRTHPDATSAITNHVQFSRAFCSGDFDGDTLPDLVVTANRGWEDYASAYAGIAFVYMGSDLSSTPKRIKGTQIGENFGMSCATADLNGDGMDELLIGAPFYSGSKTNQGRIALFHGAATWPATIVAEDADFTAYGTEAYDYMGYSAIKGGDLNSDGVVDFAVGAPFAGAGRAGKVYVFHGTGTSPGLGHKDDGFRSGYDDHDFFGWSLAAIGDVNDDGYDDLLIGGWGHLNGNNETVGRVWAVPGQPLADLRVNMTAPSFVVPYSNLTFAISVSNHGKMNDTVSVTNIQDSTGTLQVLEIVCDLCASLSCVGQSCDIGMLHVGDEVTLTIVTTLSERGELTSTVTAVSSSGDTEDVDGATSSTVTLVAAFADVSITNLVASPATAAQGEPITITWDVTATPSSQHMAFNVQVNVDGIALFQLDSTALSGGSGCLGALVCRLGSIPINNTINATVMLRASAATGAGTHTIQAVATTDSEDSFPSNDMAAVAVTIVHTVALTLDLSASPAVFTAGAGAGYVMAITNSGPSSAADMLLSLLLPEHLLDVSVIEGSGPVCNVTGRLVECTMETVPVTTVIIAVVGRVSVGVPVGVLMSEANVSTSTIEADLADNHDSVSAPVGFQADLSALAFGTDAQSSLGESLGFVVEVTNLGPSFAKNVSISIDLPPLASWVLTSFSSTGVTCSNTTLAVNCSAAVLNIGPALTITVVGTVQQTSSDEVAVIAHATSDTTDKYPANNVAGSAIRITAGADLAVVAAEVTPNPVMAGQYCTYSVTWVNLGPLTATNVFLTASQPDGVVLTTFFTDVGTCNMTGGMLVCSLDTVSVLQQGSVTVSYSIHSSAIGNMTSRIAMSSSSLDFTPENQNVSIFSPIQRLANIALSMRGVPEVVAELGSTPLNLVIALQNVGPSSAREVRVHLALADGVTFQSTPTPGIECNVSASNTSASNVTCVVGRDIEPFVTLPVLISVATEDTGPSGSTFDIVGSMSTIDPDVATVDNSATVTTAVVESYVDIALSMATAGVGLTLLHDSTTNVAFSVLNYQEVDDSNVLLTFSVHPEGAVTLLNATLTSGEQLTCTSGALGMTCPLSTVVGLGTISLFLGVRGGQYNGNFTLMGTAVTSARDVNLNNNNASSVGSVQWGSDVRASAVASPDPVFSSEVLSVLGVITVDGPSIALNVTGTLEYASNLELERCSRACNISADSRVASLALGDMYPGARVSVLFTFRVLLPEPTIASLRVGSTTPDRLMDNNIASVSPVVEQASADLELRIFAPLPVFFIDNSTTIDVLVVNNHGPRAGRNARVFGTMPRGLYIVSMATSRMSTLCAHTAWSFQTPPTNVTFSCQDVGDIVRFGTLTVSVTVAARPGAVSAASQTFAVAAQLDSDPSSIDPDLENNNATITVEVVDTQSQEGIVKEREAAIADAGVPWWLFLVIMGAIISLLYILYRLQCFHATTTEELLQEAAAQELEMEKEWENEHADELNKLAHQQMDRQPSSLMARQPSARSLGMTRSHSAVLGRQWSAASFQDGSMRSRPSSARISGRPSSARTPRVGRRDSEEPLISPIRPPRPNNI